MLTFELLSVWTTVTYPLINSHTNIRQIALVKFKLLGFFWNIIVTGTLILGVLSRLHVGIIPLAWCERKWSKRGVTTTLAVGPRLNNIELGSKGCRRGRSRSLLQGCTLQNQEHVMKSHRVARKGKHLLSLSPACILKPSIVQERAGLLQTRRILLTFPGKVKVGFKILIPLIHWVHREDCSDSVIKDPIVFSQKPFCA